MHPWKILLVLSMLLCSGQARAQVAELGPGLLVDLEQKDIFLMQPGGGVQAVDAETGQQLWQSELGDRPVYLRGEELLVQSESTSAPGRLAVQVLDSASGRSVRAVEVALPEDVIPSVQDGLGTRFEITSAGVTEPGQIAWRFVKRTMQGMPTETPPVPVRVTGLLQVDLASGALESLSQSSDAVWARPAQTESQSLPTVAGRQFSSADGAFVLASQELADLSGWDKYRWRVYTAQGQLVGETRSFTSYRPFVVIDKVLLFTTPVYARRQGGEMIASPLSVTAVSLETGQEIWKIEIRNTAYAGPLPA